MNCLRKCIFLCVFDDLLSCIYTVVPVSFRVHLCQAGLLTLQDLGPEMRLALNEDLEEEEEGLEEDQEEDDARYKVPITWTINISLEHNLITLFFIKIN